MADLSKTTLAPGVANRIALTGLTEHGVVKIGTNGKSRIVVEHELHDTGPVLGTVYDGLGPAIVADYVGTKIWVTNLGAETINIRIGQG